MRTVELAPALWSEYFSTVTREEAGSLALVRAGDGAGAEAAGSAVASPLRAISFDAERRTIELDVGGFFPAQPALRYYIEGPRSVLARKGAGWRSIVVLAADGLPTLVWLNRAAQLRGASGRPQWSRPIATPRRPAHRARVRSLTRSLPQARTSSRERPCRRAL
jgi:hypothetical protein